MDSDSEAEQWKASYRALCTVIERFGEQGKHDGADFLVSDEDQGGAMQVVFVFNLRRLSCPLLADVLQLLKDYPSWSVMFILACTDAQGRQAPPEGLVVQPGHVTELWDSAALAAQFGQDFSWPDCADTLPAVRNTCTDAGAESEAPIREKDGIALCHDAFDAAQKQLALVDEPCRTVIIVDAAWGIIGNGGFAYFFGANFPDEPDYTMFAEAFRRVGLDEIASRFAALVAQFPFSESHKSAEQRRQFIDTEPPGFMAAMEELEHLIYSRDDVDEVLNAFLQASKNAEPGLADT